MKFDFITAIWGFLQMIKTMIQLAATAPNVSREPGGTQAAITPI